MYITTTATITFIYGVAMLFAGLVAFHILSDSNKKGLREGMNNNPALVPSASNSSNVSPPPESSSTPSSTPSGDSQSKLSACGEDCSEYDKINAALNDFNKLNLNSQYKKSDEAIKKVDKDLIQLSKNVRNMGSRKTPGGKPPINKAMLS